MKLILKVCLVTTEAFHQVMPLYQKLFCPKAVENLGILAKCLLVPVE